MKAGTRVTSALVAALIPCTTVPLQVRGQHVDEAVGAAAVQAWPVVRVPQDSAVRTGGLSPLRVAKWSVLAGAAAAGVYGFVQNHRADDRFRELEQFCQAETIRCAQRTPTGEYADPEFESRYRAIRSLDRRSHIALLLSQVGVASGVVLFLLDLGNAKPPQDIPYVPGKLDVQSAAGGRLSVGLRFGLSPPPIR